MFTRAYNQQLRQFHAGYASTALVKDDYCPKDFEVALRYGYVEKTWSELEKRLEVAAAARNWDLKLATMRW